MMGMEVLGDDEESCRKLHGQRSWRTKRRFYRTWIKGRRAKRGSKGNERTGKREEWRTSDEFTFCRTLIRGQLYRAGVCLHTMNRAFSIDVVGRLTPICCAFCSLPGFSGPPLNKYGLKVPAHRGDVCVNIFKYTSVER